MYPLVPPARRTVADILTIRALLRAADALGRKEQPSLYRHVHPHGHATAKLARSFAATIQRSSAARAPTLDEIELGAHLHDFGKYLIAASILLKPGPLTKDERATVSFHPVYGAQLLSNLPAVTDAVWRIVLYHHERWDGAGYPEGLSGRRIPLEARLVSIVDVYTSLRARRAYKPPLTRREAAATMEGMAGCELDPDMTGDFLRFIGSYEHLRGSAARGAPDSSSTDAGTRARSRRSVWRAGQP